MQKPIIFLGGGVIGLSCALHARRRFPDRPVTVADAPNNPGIASRAAAGMLIPFGEFSHDSPLFRLCHASMNYYNEFLRSFIPNGPKVLDTGLLIPASGEAAAALAGLADFARQHTPVKLLTGDELKCAEPALDGPAWEAAHQLPGGVIYPARMHDALREAARREDILTIEAPVTKFHLDGSRISGVSLEGGWTIGGDEFVIATGAWSAELGAMLGLNVEVRPVKGQVARVETPEGYLRHVVLAPGIYFAPQPGGGIVIGATVEEAGFDASVREEATAELFERACAHAPGLRDFPVSASWMGFRPKFRDENPAIGRSGKYENLLFATGHYRNGILLTPITGRAVADCLEGKGEQWADFSPARLGI